MINTTAGIVFRADGFELSNLINMALKDTCELLYKKLYPSGNLHYFDTSKITGNPRNPNIKLSFLLYFRNNENNYDRAWVEKIFEVIQTKSEREWKSQCREIFSSLEIDNDHLPLEVGYETIRGLHVFLIALWARKAMLLPMSFPIPKNRITKDGNNKNSYKLDAAYNLYPPILKLLRLPFQKDLKDPDTHNILDYIPAKSRTNYNFIAWRPIVASSWIEIDDISLDDLKTLFNFIISNRSNNLVGFDYRLSPVAWIRPIMEFMDDKLAFTMNDVRSFLTDVKPAKIDDSECEFMKERDSWKIWISNYTQTLYDTGKVKDTSSIQNALDKLSDYIFVDLAGGGTQPPMVEDVVRFHMDGAGVAQPLRIVINKQIHMTQIIKFFDYVSEMQRARGAVFINPLTRFDKRSEPRPSKTNKRTFAFNAFRFFYSLSYTIFDFICFLNEKISDTLQYKDVEDILLAASLKNPIIEAEKLGYVPIVTYVDIQGKRHLVPLKFIPYSLLSLQNLPIRHEGGKVFRFMATPDNIGAVIVALETSIRFLHIRWLDKFLLVHDLPEYLDDFGSIEKLLENDRFFEMFINTDKSGIPWKRATSTRLIRIFKSINNYKKLIARNHYDIKLHYTHHELSDYPEIAPLFYDNDRATVLTEASYRNHYKHLVYFYNQIRMLDGDPPIDTLPSSNLDFNTQEAFYEAFKLFKNFQSSYTPHGIRATVISLSSTFLSPEHIGEEISGHVTASVNRYCVVDKQLVMDVNILTESKIVNSFHWSPVDAISAPATAEDLIHQSFALKPPEGNFLTNEQILERFHLLSVFSTHFCMANGKCPEDVKKDIGEFKCGQCYLGLKSKGHISAILALLRKLTCEIDSMKARLRYLDMKNISDGAAVDLERQYAALVNEFCAWSLSAEHILKNEGLLDGKFMTIGNSAKELALIELPENDQLLELLIRVNDAVCYPELTNSVLKMDVFKMSAQLMSMDTSFVEILNFGNDNQLLAEFRGKLESLMIATKSTTSQLSVALTSAETPRIPILTI